MSYYQQREVSLRATAKAIMDDPNAGLVSKQRACAILDRLERVAAKRLKNQLTATRRKKWATPSDYTPTPAQQTIIDAKLSEGLEEEATVWFQVYEREAADLAARRAS
jgi:hypothetical protein